MEGWEKQGVFEMKKGREVEGWENEDVFEVKKGGKWKGGKRKVCLR